MQTRTFGHSGLAFVLAAQLAWGCDSDDDDSSSDAASAYDAATDAGADAQQADAATAFDGGDGATMDGGQPADGATSDAGVPADAAADGAPNDAGVPADAAAEGGPADASAPVDGAIQARTEAEWILYMREEEKLARDVYRSLRMGSPVFDNIAAAEQQHLDAVQVLLERYALADPIAGLTDGMFADPTLQALYTELVARGSASLVEAFAVGAEIEERDLADLAVARSAATHQDVTVVFDNLAKGSRNHLRIFDQHLRALGVTYTPVHLDAQTYAQIVSSPMEAGPMF